MQLTEQLGKTVLYSDIALSPDGKNVAWVQSIFNPREADEHHPFVDYADARLDSYAGRISWAASPRVVTSAWWGYLSTHDRLDPDSRMHRYGASVLTEARGPGGGRLSSALIWGLNVHDHGAGHDHGEPGALPVSPHHASHSVLAESSLEIGSRNSVFARLERVQKSGQDLGFQGGDLTTLYDVRSIAFGFTRTVATAGRVGFAVGARGSVNFIPETLLLTYGTRAPAGFAVYTQVRPNGPGR